MEKFYTEAEVTLRATSKMRLKLRRPSIVKATSSLEMLESWKIMFLLLLEEARSSLLLQEGKTWLLF